MRALLASSTTFNATFAGAETPQIMRRSARFECPRFRDGSLVACSAPSFHTFRKPMDSAIAVTDGSLRGIPAEPAALVAINDDNMIVIAARHLRQKLAEQ